MFLAAVCLAFLTHIAFETRMWISSWIPAISIPVWLQFYFIFIYWFGNLECFKSWNTRRADVLCSLMALFIQQVRRTAGGLQLHDYFVELHTEGVDPDMIKVSKLYSSKCRSYLQHFFNLTLTISSFDGCGLYTQERSVGPVLSRVK